MLLFTNCRINSNRPGLEAVTRAFTPGAPDLNLVEVSKVKGRYLVSGVVATDALLKEKLAEVFSGPRPVLFFVHGFDNSFTDLYERCQKLERAYGVNAIGFCWPGEGYVDDGADVARPIIRNAVSIESGRFLFRLKKGGFIARIAARYQQAKQNCVDSGAAFERLLSQVAAARLAASIQPFTLAIHSLGNLFLTPAARKSTFRNSLSQASNVILLAACVLHPRHHQWLKHVRPQRKNYVTSAENDSVLAAASATDGQGKMLGELREVTDSVTDGSVRYVKFLESAAAATLAHSYFDIPEVLKESKGFFTRVFTSQPDLEVTGSNAPYQIEDHMFAVVGIAPTKPVAKKRGAKPIGKKPAKKVAKKVAGKTAPRARAA